jgi:glycosyltransferase involved in cell wall biosynthesis
MSFVALRSLRSHSTIRRQATTAARVPSPPHRIDHGASRGRRRRLRIALLAPPWIPVPPPGYGGIESVVAHLALGLVRREHDVTLLAAPGSASPARVVALLEHDHPSEIGNTRIEVDHVVQAIETVADAAEQRPFDIVHDHSGFVMFAMAEAMPAPVLHTVHGPLDAETAAFYGRHAHRAWVAGLSSSQLRDAPPNLRCVGAIPNPMDVDAWPFAAEKDDYLLWIGRMTAEKGPHRAIAAARAAGRRLIMAGPVQPGQQEFFESEVAPHVDGTTVQYVGEVGGAVKQRLYADAAGLLMPIRWAEPFGMVMAEAMVCGTPVIAFREGAAPEVVVDGVSGFVVADEAEMATAIGRLPEIDPAGCRATVERRFGIDVIAGRYERAYRQVIAARP